jgi:putative DNA primase/helicase
LSSQHQKIIHRLENIKSTGSGQWQALCPAHEDKKPSLSIGTGDDGRVLLKCHAGCDIKDILAAINLTERDLFTRSKSKSSKTIETTYDYQDAGGNLLYQVVRFTDKTFKQRRKNARGRWVNQVKKTPKVLYRLPEILSANSEDWIFIVEGEKDVDNLVKHDLVATTNSGGGNAWKYLSDDSALHDRRVVIIPDKDETGYQHADEVGNSLNGKPRELRYLVLDGDGKDVTDWLDAGGTHEKLLELVDDAPRWTPEISIQYAWPDPQSLDHGLTYVLPFDYKLLPETLRDWISDIAERMQCPPDFPAVTSMIALGGVVGRQMSIRPKKFDDWTVVPNLWGALIGRPSMMKTPPLKSTLTPLDMLNSAEFEKYSQQMAEFEKKVRLGQLRKNVLENQIKTAMRRGQDYEELSREIAKIDQICTPLRRRYVVNDCTVQALGQILSENPYGVIAVRDELIGLLKFLESVGQESSRAFFLEGWDGNGAHEIDRIGRGNVRIEGVCISLIGTIQPGPLQQYLRDAVEGGSGDDGLIQRFQMGVWPDDPSDWKNIDRKPNQDAANLAYDVFARLNKVSPEMIGAKLNILQNRPIPYLRFSDSAQCLFNDWMVTRENRLRRGLEDSAMESHLTKFRSLIPSLALLIHLAEFQTGPVMYDAAERAIQWGDYLISHARRIYASAQVADDRTEDLLAAKIQQGHLANGFTVRDVYSRHWTGLGDRPQIEQDLQQLAEYGWVRPESPATGGRRTTKFRINPKLFK